MAEATQVILVIAAILGIAAAILTIVRIALGPTLYDRAVAADLLTAVGIAVVSVLIAWHGRTDLGALLVVFALTGFFSSVVIARFTPGAGGRRVGTLTKSEAQLRARQSDKVSPDPAELQQDKPAKNERFGSGAQ